METRYSRSYRLLLPALVIGIFAASCSSAPPPPATPTATPAASPVPLANVAFREVAGGLSFPVLITNAGDGSGRLFIVEQTGYVVIIKDGQLLPTPFLDIHGDVIADPVQDEEPGLLALAFHPDYARNGYFYVVYTAPNPSEPKGETLVLKRFKVSETPDVADYDSGLVILAIDHPDTHSHNGSSLAFGPDGYLYWGTGDGGTQRDLANNGQTLSTLLGKILRLDVDSASPYAIPRSNPFYGDTSSPKIRQEIWDYGLRNPWRISFDSKTGDLYIADAGEHNWEEVDFEPAGSPGGNNYGWRLMEGSHCYHPTSDCDPTNSTVRPVTEYRHIDGRCVIVGGYVYRGSADPAFDGYYVYGDYCAGTLFAVRKTSAAAWDPTVLAYTDYIISSFGQDENGELYLANHFAGEIYQLRFEQ